MIFKCNEFVVNQKCVLSDDVRLRYELPVTTNPFFESGYSPNKAKPGKCEAVDLTITEDNRDRIEYGRP